MTENIPVKRRNEEVYSLAYIYQNNNNLPQNGYMEDKSLAEMLTHHRNISENPYEVVRKPPKKRKKIDENCFENKGLNLNTPETQFNPFEVQRLPKSLVEGFEKENHSFVNLALNLKAPDAKTQNPFEIIRTENDLNEDDDGIESKEMQGYENPGLDLKVPPPPIAIAVPFTPTINHRIDFGQMKTPETPSSLLQKKLVFSPKEQNCATPKRLFRKSLSTISEEAVDIDEELDCYQLQLENSINEAKLNNRKYFTDIRKDVLKSKLTKSIATVEAKENEKENNKPEEPEDVEIDENDSFDDDFKITDGNYQPFKRAYRRPVASQPPSAMAPPLIPTKPESSGGIKNIIRRSIRKITKPKTKKGSMESLPEEEKHEKGNTIMASIRNSLRKRKREYPQADNLEISIISDTERKIFKEPTLKGPSIVAPKETAFITATRNSIRRSTRGVMKNVFHKPQENYALD